MSDYNRETDVRNEIVKLRKTITDLHLSFRDQAAIALMATLVQTDGPEAADDFTAINARIAFNAAVVLDSERRKRNAEVQQGT